MPSIDELVQIAAGLPAWALVLGVFAAAYAEFIFPPIWGDVAMLLGFFLAGRGAAPLSLIFAAAVLAGVLGAATAYGLGRHYGAPILRKALRSREAEKNLDHLGDLFDRWGEPFLAINRFVPVARGMMVYGAGILELRFWRSMFWNAVGTLAYVGLLLGLGLFAARSWDALYSLFRDTMGWVGLAAGIVFLAGIAWVWRRASERLREMASLDDEDAS